MFLPVSCQQFILDNKSVEQLCCKISPRNKSKESEGNSPLLTGRYKQSFYAEEKRQGVSIPLCVFVYKGIPSDKHIYDILTIFIGSHVEQVDNNEIQAGVLCKPVLSRVVQWFLGGEEREADACTQKEYNSGLEC